MYSTGQDVPSIEVQPALLWVSETGVNATEGYQWGDSGPYETFTADLGELFRAMRREYGRCVSRIYVDQEGSAPIAVGWVFQKRAKYEDTGKPYLQETWITVLDGPDTVKRTHHYHKISR